MGQPDKEFIKRLRSLVGENVSGFARDLGISQPSLHGYLTGGYTPGFDFFVKLAKRGVDLNWLLIGTAGNAKQKEKVIKAQQLAALLSKLTKEDAEVATKTLKAVIRALSEARSS